jgi:hypothetical protein
VIAGHNVPFRTNLNILVSWVCQSQGRIFHRALGARAQGPPQNGAPHRSQSHTSLVCSIVVLHVRNAIRLTKHQKCPGPQNRKSGPGQSCVAFQKLSDNMWSLEEMEIRIAMSIEKTVYKPNHRRGVREYVPCNAI